MLTRRLKELEPEKEPSPEQLHGEVEIESTVKETVISGAPSQFVSERNRPQTPTMAPSSPNREKKSLQSEPSVKSDRDPSLPCRDLLSVAKNRPFQAVWIGIDSRASTRSRFSSGSP